MAVRVASCLLGETTTLETSRPRLERPAARPFRLRRVLFRPRGGGASRRLAPDSRVEGGAIRREVDRKLPRRHAGDRAGRLAIDPDVVKRPEQQGGYELKTRLGRIMRRLLRDIAEGRVLGDTTTPADPTWSPR